MNKAISLLGLLGVPLFGVAHELEGSVQEPIVTEIPRPATRQEVIASGFSKLFNPASYELYIIIWIIGICIFMYIGNKDNQKICHEWLSKITTSISRHFKVVGSIKTLQTESNNVFTLYSTGNDSLLGLTCTLELKKRQDFLYLLYNYFRGANNDLVTYEVFLPNSVPKCMLVLLRNKFESFYKEYHKDVSAFGTTSMNNIDFNIKFTSCYMDGDAIKNLPSFNSWIRLMSQNPQFFHSAHISDITYSTSYGGSGVLKKKTAIEDKDDFSLGCVNDNSPFKIEDKFEVGPFARVTLRLPKTEEEYNTHFNIFNSFMLVCTQLVNQGKNSANAEQAITDKRLKYYNKVNKQYFDNINEQKKDSKFQKMTEAEKRAYIEKQEKKKNKITGGKVKRIVI